MRKCGRRLFARLLLWRALSVSYTTFAGLVAGGIGAILLAWSMNASTRDFLEDPGR